MLIIRQIIQFAWSRYTTFRLNKINSLEIRLFSYFIETATDILNSDPKLGPLADNGGPTLTYALLPGSPAIDAIRPDCSNVVVSLETGFLAVELDGEPITRDQRGLPRPQGKGCDIGAFEAVPGS